MGSVVLLKNAVLDKHRMLFCVALRPTNMVVVVGVDFGVYVAEKLEMPQISTAA